MNLTYILYTYLITALIFLTVLLVERKIQPQEFVLAALLFLMPGMNIVAYLAEMILSIIRRKNKN